MRSTWAGGCTRYLQGRWVEPLVEEALQPKAARRSKGAIKLRHFRPKALVRRPGVGVCVRWERYAEEGKRRLGGHESDVASIAWWELRVYTGT